MALGQLCYKKNGSALCYKKNGSALVYKGEPRPIYVVIAWAPHEFTCQTYGQTHTIYGDISYRFTQGSGTIGHTVATRTDDNRLWIAVTQRPAKIELTLSCSMTCAADEYAVVTFRLMASQRGVSPKMKSASPPGAPSSSTTATINVDANGNLTSIT